MGLTAEGQDKLHEKPVLREEREWIHATGRGEGCPSEGRAIYAPRGEVPKPCDAPVPTPYGPQACGNRDWDASDYVKRDQYNNIVFRSKSDSK